MQLIEEKSNEAHVVDFVKKIKEQIDIADLTKTISEYDDILNEYTKGYIDRDKVLSKYDEFCKKNPEYNLIITSLLFRRKRNK